MVHNNHTLILVFVSELSRSALPDVDALRTCQRLFSYTVNALKGFVGGAAPALPAQSPADPLSASHQGDSVDNSYSTIGSIMKYIASSETSEENQVRSHHISLLAFILYLSLTMFIRCVYI